MTDTLTYGICNSMKMHRLSSLGATGKRIRKNLWLIKHDDYYALRLHGTEIVQIYLDRWEIRTGGWKTPTTKKNIEQYGPIQICSHKRVWYYSIKNDNTQNCWHRFEEGMSISKENL